MTSLVESPSVIRKSDRSPCEIIRKDNACYLIRTSEGKKEFVFEDEIELVVNSPSQTTVASVAAKSNPCTPINTMGKRELDEQI